MNLPRIPIKNWSDLELKSVIHKYANDDKHDVPFSTFLDYIREAKKRGYTQDEIADLWLNGIF